MKEIRATPGSSIPIGRCGENLARTVLFDIAAWVGMYSSGTAQLIHQRPGEEAPYPCNVETEGSDIRWPVLSTDTAIPGDGKAELQYIAGDQIVKSCTFQTFVSEALSAPSESPPEPSKPWVDKVLAAGEAATEAAGEAQDAASRAEEAARKAELATGTLEIGDGLKWVGQKLTVDTADAVQHDNTKPITSAAVYTEIGNIEALLAAI